MASKARQGRMHAKNNASRMEGEMTGLKKSVCVLFLLVDLWMETEKIWNKWSWIKSIGSRKWVWLLYRCWYTDVDVSKLSISNMPKTWIQRWEISHLTSSLQVGSGCVAGNYGLLRLHPINPGKSSLETIPGNSFVTWIGTQIQQVERNFFSSWIFPKGLTSPL